MNTSEAPIFIGIDGGGTKCRAVVFDREYNQLSTAVAGPANVAKYGKLAYDEMLAAVREALHRLNLEIESEQHRLFVGAGLAGVNVPSAARALQQWQHPFARFDFTSDIHAALLGAHNGNDGAVLIAGTGSCAAGLKGNAVKQFGGHGFALGDKGSGAWLGKTALAKTLESLDGVILASDFTRDLQQHLSIRSANDIVDVYNQAPPSAFAELAPLVIAAARDRDPIALPIVVEGAVYLSNIASRALIYSGNKLALVGGVIEGILPWLDENLNPSTASAHHGPEHGAVIYQRTKLQAKGQ
ncbi:BadF/BadG/BcrA/BcrD ATPase family protein [Glaciecola sp. SC05]|uniref:BadF/BadG/BcrA/BcrD ATPase family protein n=1 Tax=Glaciecola sp. SC05 TaxID=1987355 RepID=UPI0035299F14